jgi:hypothetical protein
MLAVRTIVLVLGVIVLALASFAARAALHKTGSCVEESCPTSACP